MIGIMLSSWGCSKQKERNAWQTEISLKQPWCSLSLFSQFNSGTQTSSTGPSCVISQRHNSPLKNNSHRAPREGLWGTANKTDGQKEGQTDIQTDGQTDRQTDVRTDRYQMHRSRDLNVSFMVMCLRIVTSPGIAPVCTGRTSGRAGDRGQRAGRLLMRTTGGERPRQARGWNWSQSRCTMYHEEEKEEEEEEEHSVEESSYHGPTLCSTADWYHVWQWVDTHWRYPMLKCLGFKSHKEVCSLFLTIWIKCIISL